MKRVLLLATVVSVAAQAKHDDHAHHQEPASARDAQIIVTINPEARVSAVVAAPMPPPDKCGETAELKVQVLNQGFVTAPLRAAIVNYGESRVGLHMDASKLSGGPEDTRLLHLTPLSPGATDVTIAFSIDNKIGDLSGRDRVHLLLRCPQKEAETKTQQRNLPSSIVRFPKNTEEFNRIFEEIKNWGRWGADDQLGTLNLITDQKREQAFASVRLWRSIGLAHRLLTESAADNLNPFEHAMNLYPDAALDTYRVSYHGTAHSHIDALCHVSYKGETYNGYPAKEVITDRGCAKLGIENLRNGIITRGILIDIPRLKNLPYLEPGAPVSVEDIEAWEKKTHVRISTGDAILLRTGRWARRAKLGAWNVIESTAGFHASVAPWLKARGVAIIGSDSALDVLPSQVEGVWLPMHTLVIVSLGMMILDNQDLEAAAETAEQLNRWGFLLSIAPLPVAGGTGSPVNSVAIF